MKVRSTKELQLFEGTFLAQARGEETDLRMYRGSAILRRGVKSMCRTGYADFVWRVQSKLTRQSFLQKKPRRKMSSVRSRDQSSHTDSPIHRESSEEVKREPNDDGLRLFELFTKLKQDE